MLQILQVTDYTCNKFRVLSQNSLENVKLPVGVENRRCSRCLNSQSYEIRLETFRIVERNLFQVKGVLVQDLEPMLP